MAGPADWGAVPVEAPKGPQAWGAVPKDQTSVTEDIAKTALPSVGRGVVAAITAAPSLAELAMQGMEVGAQKLGEYGYIPKGIGNYLKESREATEKSRANSLIPIPTYSNVMGMIEGATGPWYKAKTGPGKVAQTAIEFAPSMRSLGNLRPTPTPAANSTVGDIVKGLSAGAGSEAAGQAVEALGYDPYADYARFGGALLGGAAPTMARRAVTPFPANARHTEAVNFLRSRAPEMPITAGQATGNKALQSLEGKNAGSVAAPSWIKTLPEDQATAFTGAVRRETGAAGGLADDVSLLANERSLRGNLDNIISTAHIPPRNFNTLYNDITTIYRGLRNVVGTDAAKNVAGLQNEIKAGAATTGVFSMRGKRYQYFRDKIQNLIENAASPDERRAFSQIRERLDNAMYSSLPADQSEALKRLQTQYANQKVLSNANIAPEGTVRPSDMKSAIKNRWGTEGYNLGRGDVSKLTNAGDRVMKDLPNSPMPHERPAAQVLGALLGGGGAAAGGIGHAGAEGAVLGLLAGPGLVNLATANPVMARSVFNPTMQRYLSNQRFLPTPATSIDNAAIIRALASRPGMQPVPLPPSQ